MHLLGEVPDLVEPEVREEDQRGGAGQARNAMGHLQVGHAPQSGSPIAITNSRPAASTTVEEDREPDGLADACQEDDDRDREERGAFATAGVPTRCAR